MFLFHERRGVSLISASLLVCRLPLRMSPHLSSAPRFPHPVPSQAPVLVMRLGSGLYYHHVLDLRTQRTGVWVTSSATQLVTGRARCPPTSPRPHVKPPTRPRATPSAPPLAPPLEAPPSRPWPRPTHLSRPSAPPTCPAPRSLSVPPTGTGPAPGPHRPRPAPARAAEDPE